MNIKDIEKIEEAVKILHPYQYIYPYSYSISRDEEEKREKYLDNKVLYYIKTGVKPEELFKKALKLKADQVKKNKLAEIEIKRRQEEYKKEREEKQKNCKHDWEYFNETKDSNNCSHRKEIKLYNIFPWNLEKCKKCELEKRFIN